MSVWICEGKTNWVTINLKPKTRVYPGNVRILPYKELGALSRSKLYISGAVGWTGVGRGLIESVGGKSWVLDYAISQSDRAPRSTRAAHNTTLDDEDRE